MLAAMLIANVLHAAQPTAPPPYAPAVPSGVEVSSKVRLYDIRGSTMSTLRRQMKRRGPIKWAAYTRWFLSWNWETERRDGQCHLVVPEASVRVKFRFPSWLPSEAADEATVRAYDSYAAGLWVHETGHADIAVDTATKIVSDLEGLPPRDTCRLLRKDAADVSLAHYRRAGITEKAYDRDTDHGATQIYGPSPR